MSGHTSIAAAQVLAQESPALVLLDGEPEVTRGWQRTLEAKLRPGLLCIDLAGVPDAPAALVKGAALTGSAVAWICRGMTCLPPVASEEALLRALEKGPGSIFTVPTR